MHDSKNAELSFSPNCNSEKEEITELLDDSQTSRTHWTCVVSALAMWANAFPQDILLRLSINLPFVQLKTVTGVAA